MRKVTHWQHTSRWKISRRREKKRSRGGKKRRGEGEGGRDHLQGVQGMGEKGRIRGRQLVLVKFPVVEVQAFDILTGSRFRDAATHTAE